MKIQNVCDVVLFNSISDLLNVYCMTDVRNMISKIQTLLEFTKWLGQPLGKLLQRGNYGEVVCVSFRGECN